MARLWLSGFELNSTTADEEFTTVTWSGSTIQTGTVRSGTYAGEITSLASATRQGFAYQFAAAAANGPYYVRFALRIATLPSAENTIFTLGNNATLASATIGAKITLDNGGLLRLYNATTQVGSASAALSTGIWYEIEVWYDKSLTAGSQVLKARINQASDFASSSSLTIANAVDVAAFGANLNAESQTTGDWFFDDIAINDSTGSFQNTYPGSGKIVHLRPSAAGDNAAWTRGGSDSGANWSQVSEVNPDDNTAYVKKVTTTGIDDYNLDDTPSELNAGSTIKVVAVGVRFRGDPP
jgi:hypothetical protein